MAAITTTVTAITEMVIWQMEAVLFYAIVGQPNLNSVRHLVEQLETFTSHFATTKWGGKHGFLPLVLSKIKMRLAAGDNNLNCERLNKLELPSSRISDSTNGQKFLYLQEDQKFKCQEYTFKEVVNSVAVEAIFSAVDAQYIEEPKEDYVGHKNQTIKKWSPRSARGMLLPPRRICP